MVAVEWVIIPFCQKSQNVFAQKCQKSQNVCPILPVLSKISKCFCLKMSKISKCLLILFFLINMLPNEISMLKNFGV